MKNLAIIIFFSVFIYLNAAVQADELPGQPETDENYLTIHIFGIEPDTKLLTDAPCELIITDPQGRKIGFDPIEKKIYHEIPHAEYGGESIADADSGEPGAGSLNLQITDPLEGEYQFEIIGITSGLYKIEMQAYVLGLHSSSEEFNNVQIKKGEVHKYKFHYKKKEGFEIKLIRLNTGKEK